MTRFTTLLIVCALASPLAVHAGSRPTLPQQLAQAEANYCGSLGKLASTISTWLERGTTYQDILDGIDTVLAEGPRDPKAIKRNAVFRRVAQQVALTPSWSPTQARTGIEMACLRGDYP